MFSRMLNILKFFLTKPSVAMLPAAVVASVCALVGNADQAFGQSGWANPLIQSRAEVSIKLQSPVVHCHQSTVRIKDIAVLESSNTNLIRKIEQLDIDNFTETKHQIVVGRQQIQIRLLLAGITVDLQDISGPEHVRVVFAQPQDIRRLLELRLQSQLAKRFGIPESDIQASIASDVEELSQATAQSITLETGRLMQAEMPLGRTTIDATLQSASGQTQTLRVPVTIALFQDVVVATKSIPKGTVLDRENMTSVRRPVSSRSTRVVSLEDALGKQVVSDLQKYSLIKSSFIRAARGRNHVIKKNTYVDVVLRRGNLTVVLKNARTLDNGNAGSAIPIINPQNNERMVAKVIDAATVEIR